MTSPSLFRVQQGAIHVNSISVYHRSDEAVVFAADLRQKYAEILCFSSTSEGGHSVSLTAGERTLRVDDPGAGFTEIHVELTGERWVLLGEVTRYTLWCCAVRCVDAPQYEELGWSDEGDG